MNFQTRKLSDSFDHYSLIFQLHAYVLINRYSLLCVDVSISMALFIKYPAQIKYMYNMIML